MRCKPHVLYILRSRALMFMGLEEQTLPINDHLLAVGISSTDSVNMKPWTSFSVNTIPPSIAERLAIASGVLLTTGESPSPCDRRDVTSDLDLSFAAHHGVVVFCSDASAFLPPSFFATMPPSMEHQTKTIRVREASSLPRTPPAYPDHLR